MSLSLASTTGMIIAKIVGGALLSQYHWRQVCLLSAAVGVFGSVMLYFFGINEMSYSKSTSRNNNNKAQEAGSINQLNRQDTDDTSGLTLKSIKSSISNVLGNRMFYAIACAHFGLGGVDGGPCLDTRHRKNNWPSEWPTVSENKN